MIITNLKPNRDQRADAPARSISFWLERRVNGDIALVAEPEGLPEHRSALLIVRTETGVIDLCRFVSEEIGLFLEDEGVPETGVASCIE